MSDSPKPISDPTRPRYRVGDLLIDSGPQRVTRGGEEIALPRLSYDLLITLILDAPNLVSNDALMERVWPKVVVSPETLSQRVKLLRDALGDDPRKPRYVEGVRARGYRLIPVVERDSAAATVVDVPTPAGMAPNASPPHGVSPTQAGDPLPGRPRPSRRRWLVAGGVSVASLLAAWVGLRVAHVLKPDVQRTSVDVVADQPRMLAVLPFENLSTEPGNEYIALGIAESVLNRLGSVRELTVIARSSSFALGNRRPDVRETGRRLGVRYIVAGSVQRAGRTLRVNAQLIDAMSNRELWALSFDRTIDDVFAVQDEIAQRVGEKLEVGLQGRAAPFATYGTDAYLAFLKGRALVESRKIDSVEGSLREFSRAIELAPSFATAMVELGYAKLLLADLRGEPYQRAGNLLPEIKSLADRAIEINPSAGEPYYLRGMYRINAKNDASGAEADFRKGLELAPYYGRGIDTLAGAWAEQGRIAEVIAIIDRATLVDPLSPRLFYLKGEMLRMGVRDWEQAAAAYLQALAVAPEFYPALTRLAHVRAREGKLADAINYGERSIAIEPKVRWTRSRLVWYYVDIDDLDAARDVMRRFDHDSSQELADEAMICYRAGNLQRADLIARRALKYPGSQEAGMAFVLATKAVVEHAIAVHTPDSARQAILAIPGLKQVRGTLAVVEDNFPEVVDLAVLEHAAGNDKVARDLADRILKFLNDKNHVDGPTEDDRERAAALVVLGRNDEAMSHLETLMSTGSRLRWWQTLERDPGFSVLRTTPRFQAIVSSARSWLAGQQQSLFQMRQRGDVPRRSAAAMPGGC